MQLASHNQTPLTAAAVRQCIAYIQHTNVKGVVIMRCPPALVIHLTTPFGLLLLHVHVSVHININTDAGTLHAHAFVVGQHQSLTTRIEACLLHSVRNCAMQ